MLKIVLWISWCVLFKRTLTWTHIGLCVCAFFSLLFAKLDCMVWWCVDKRILGLFCIASPKPSLTCTQSWSLSSLFFSSLSLLCYSLLCVCVSLCHSLSLFLDVSLSLSLCLSVTVCLFLYCSLSFSLFFVSVYAFQLYLDLLPFRCTTLGLLMILGMFYPHYMLLFQMLAVLDVSSHWMQMYRYFY